MYGEDKTSLEELKNAVNELQSLKIEILPKKNKVKELNNSIAKMENQIKHVDENLLNNINANDGESSTENTSAEEIQGILTSENSNFNILSSNIDTLMEKVNQVVKVETERKTWQEELAKFAGTYVNKNSLDNDKRTLKADGTLISQDGKEQKPMGFDRRKDGSIHVQTGFNSTITNDLVSKGYTLYPIGVGNYYEGDNSKMRLGISDGVSINIYEKE